MTATRKARKYWTCPACLTRNERIKQKCGGEGCNRSRPKAHVPAHARTLRDDSFETYRDLNEIIHGPAMLAVLPDWEPEDCGCCGRKPKDSRNMDREHGHDKTEHSYGKPRGLACPGDWGCNRLMAKLSLVKARQIVAFLERAEEFNGRAEAQ